MQNFSISMLGLAIIIMGLGQIGSCGNDVLNQAEIQKLEQRVLKLEQQSKPFVFPSLESRVNQLEVLEKIHHGSP